MAFVTNQSLITIVITFLFISRCKCTDYCGVNICNNSKEHTLCKNPLSDPARHCIDFEKTINTDLDKKAILNKINSRRNKVAAGEIRSIPSAANMLKLDWNVELEKSAQRWANQCVKHSVPDIQDSCRDLEGVPVGQNIATILGEAPGLAAVSLVDVWYMELLNTNVSILIKYQPSFIEVNSHYDYFTQLIWAESNQVGCGGVKFKERYEDEIGVKNRTIYRLVCNFAPGGNRWNNSVYIHGLPCSRCPPDTRCDFIHKSLCILTEYVNKETGKEKSESIDISTDLTTGSIIDETSNVPATENSLSLNISKNKDSLEFDDFTLFDFMSDSYHFTRKTISEATTTKSDTCNQSIEVDDIVELLKKKLINDPIFKESLVTKSAQNFYNGEGTFTDSSVEAFVSKIYSQKEAPTTIKAVDTDYVNSTLLVDLVEAVIFKSYLPSGYPYETTQTVSEVTPLRIQAELAEKKSNYDFTGHYFFPEDDDDPTTETSEFYYDVSSNLPLVDVVLEIENIKKSSFTKDFLEEIIDSDSVSETTSTQNLSPDDMTIYKSGHSVMKKFLKDIEDISRNASIHDTK
ncbi:hypothetical protein K1T71_005675 [Dendrolimus kikuchii]|uniref:Uncharacterized protein n=1 Tax=Dendrolimus kikuchii TaxID=765133 RepID=A0ACC1D514_9NEOP|nr:hypothetical protein K1T71_005675 [Dendrolimus kikuchii]